jgi:hypothetical protein
VVPCWGMRRVARLLLTVSLLLSASAHVYAEPTPEQREQARAFANEGLALFKKGDYAGAIDKFEKAEGVVHAPPHVLYIARAHAKSGKLRVAREIYKRIVSEALGPKPPRPFQAAQQEAGRELDTLEDQIPRLRVEVSGAPRESTRVTVDGQEMTEAEMELDPGAHTVVGESEGLRGEAKIDLAAGAHETVSLTLAEPSESDSNGSNGGEETGSDIPFEPVILMAAGGALMVVGAVTGGLALNKAAELRELCPTNPCSPDNEPLSEDAKRLATISTTFFVIGGAATAAGAGWLIYRLVNDDSDTDRPVAIAPILAPGFVGLSGRFR